RRSSDLHFVGRRFFIPSQTQEISSDLAPPSATRIITLTPKVFIQYFILPTYIRIHVGVKSILNDTHFHIVIQRGLPASGMRFVCKHCIVISAKEIWQPVK